MTEPITLNTDGPHSPEYTRQVTQTMAAALRSRSRSPAAGSSCAWPSPTRTPTSSGTPHHACWNGHRRRLSGCTSRRSGNGGGHRQRLHELLPLAHRLGVPILAEHGLEPSAALQAATTTGYRFLGEHFDQAGQPAALVTYQDDPREDLAVLS